LIIKHETKVLESTDFRQATFLKILYLAMLKCLRFTYLLCNGQ